MLIRAKCKNINGCLLCVCIDSAHTPAAFLIMIEAGLLFRVNEILVGLLLATVYISLTYKTILAGRYGMFLSDLHCKFKPLSKASFHE